MGWLPEEEPLRQLAIYLRNSLSGHDQTAQKQATMMLSQAKSSPDINNYLAFLFAHREIPGNLNFSIDEYHMVRTSAAIMLKNDIKTSYKTISPTSQEYIRSTTLSCLQDSNPQIRNYAGNVITEVVRTGGILAWPDLLSTLLALITNEQGNVVQGTQEGAISALLKICEDNKRALDRDYQGRRPLNVLIPKLLDLTGSSNAKIRALALASINIFIPQKPQALLVSVDSLLSRLFNLAEDESNEVLKYVCRAFVLLVDVCPEKIFPHMEGLVNFMITEQRRSDDPELSLDAAEFWLTVGEHDKLCAKLGPYLDRIIPVLFESMVYSEEEVMLLEDDEEDADVEDRAEDIKPQFAKSRTARAAAGAENKHNSNPQKNGYTAVSMPDDDDELSEGEIEESEDGASGDPEDQWTLRKCSAAALDVLASVFHRPVFEITLPYLKDNLQHNEWPRREAAVLALGALADGCLDAVTPHLPDLVPYLISLLSDPSPIVRQITCWSLGRYSSWASRLDDPADKARFFEPMMEGLLDRMLDNKKRVQEAAASAFANLEEKAQECLRPYCQPIVQQFVRCFERYKDKNMFILYDCVQTLAESVGQALASQGLLDILMPALIQRWHKVSDQSRELFPLQECLSYVAGALQDAFTPYAAPVFARCVRVIHQNLQEYILAVNNQALDQPDKDFLVTSLDLLSSIIQALDPSRSSELVGMTQPSFFELLNFCLEDPNNEVRQSAYALLGDCAIFVYEQLKPHLPSIIPILIKQLDLDNMKDEEIETGFPVLNNACWACGEISMKEGSGVHPFINQLYDKLLAIITNLEVPESVNENAAIALGRLGIVASSQLAPHLADFAGPFLESISKVEYTQEKDHALQGFCMVVGLNPEAMESCLKPFFETIARYPDLSYRENLQPIFQQVLSGYKNLIPNFSAFIGQLSQSDQVSLRKIYSI